MRRGRLARLATLFLLITSTAMPVSTAIPVTKDPAAAPILVSCAASLQDVIRSLAERYERRRPGVRILVNSGASGLLARQIEQGAPVDLFLSADERTMQELVARGWVDAAAIVPFATNRIVAICPRDRLIRVDAPADLAGPSVRLVALPDTTVPIGRYARVFLERAGLRGRLADRIARTEDARASVAAVATGAADLAFVYATDAASNPRVRAVWTIPPAMLPPVRSVAALVKRSGCHPAAGGLLSFLRSAEAGEVLRAAGFLRPDSGDAR